MARLAVLGGKPIAEGRMKITWPIVGKEEKDAILQTLARKEWCRFGLPDDECQNAMFEREWADYHDAKHALTVCNGTVALMCAFRAVGVGPGDEVIVPAITFSATADAVALCGGIPVFADMDPDTYQVDHAAVEAAVTDKTKAICVVHYAGYPCDLDRFAQLAVKTGLPVIEDCAHAQGSEWRGRKVGAHITGGCFSFQQSKSLTSGEGGALVTESEPLIELLWSIQNCGRIRGADRYDHTALGGNFRLSEWEATILRTQLKRLPGQTLQRMENAALISEAVGEIDGLEVLKKDDRVTQRGYYFYVIRYRSEGWDGITREAFLRALHAEGMPVGRGYSYPVYMNRSYSEGVIPHRVAGCPKAEWAAANEQITLANHALLEHANVRLFIDAIYKVRENMDELRKYDRVLSAA